MLYADDLTFVSESLEGLKGELEAWKRPLELKGSRLNLKTKMMISSENSGSRTEEGNFLHAVNRKGAGRKSMLYQFCRCVVCIRNIVYLKEDSEFKCQLCVNQQTDIEEDWPGIELNGQSLELSWRLTCY